METALVLVVAGILSAVLARPIAAMLFPALSQTNFSGETIPTGLGLALLLAVLAALGCLSYLGWPGGRGLFLAAFWLTVVSLAGLVDDIAGSSESRGFRGHFRALFHGQLTTGMLKVLIVSGAALAVANWRLGWLAWVEIGVLVLSVNLFNQLDLRPGRALKCYLALSTVLTLQGNAIAGIGWGGAAGLLMGDLRARYMLGDTGANLLGALLGLSLIEIFSGIWLLVILISLALGNALGEFSSFSRLIAANKILRWLDQIGR